jgi:PIN domain nuclease of toxin-antitoxin system
VRLLLDTHTLLWWLSEQPRLSATARNAISHDDAPVIVSAASAWEICTKVRIGKRPTAFAVCEDFHAVLARNGFEPLAITVEHGRAADRLPGAHKDPFDRMLAAQALIEDVPIVTNDAAFAGFGVKVIW